MSTAIFVVLIGAYSIVGVAVAVFLMISDFTQKKTSGSGILLEIASLHIAGFFIFLALWPIWLFVLWHGSKDIESGAVVEKDNEHLKIDHLPKE